MKRIVIIAALCIGLGGCPSQEGGIDPRIAKPNLPPVPPYLVNCFKGVTDIPKKSASVPELLTILAKVRKSEAYKTKCGQRFEAWYNTVRKSYGASR